jgi:serine/threonine-protein kinase RsbW
VTHDPRAPVVMRALAEPSAIAVARQVATAVALVAGMDAEGVQDVKVAVTEAFTNAVRHAYPDSAPGPVTVAAWTTSRAVVLSVRDEGVGVDAGRGHESGVGMLTMAALASELSVRTSERGTELIMAFPAPGAAPAADSGRRVGWASDQGPTEQ